MHKNEKNGNQLVQLIPEDDGTYHLRLRKDLPFRKEGESSVIEVSGLKLKYLEELVRNIILAPTREQGKKPITYRFHKRKDRGWYLQIMIETDKKDCWQFVSNGCLSIDYNNRMLAVAELDEYGNLVDDFIIPLNYHGTGGRAKAEIRDVVKDLALRGYDKGKPVVHENLDFIRTKAGVEDNKEYNKMIHSFDYSRFIESLERACERNGVKCIGVNPANTTKIGVGKFKERMKLSNHICAAFEIGRRAQGHWDSLEY